MKRYKLDFATSIQCSLQRKIGRQSTFFLNRSNVDFPDAQKSTFIFEMCYKNQVFCKRDSNAIDTFLKNGLSIA